MSYTELHSDFAPSRARGRECYSRTDFPSHENLSISYSVTRRPSLPGIIGSVTWGCQLTSAARSERFRSAPRVHGFVPGLDRPVTCHQVCPLIRCRPSEQRLKSEMLGGKMPAIFRVSAWPRGPQFWSFPSRHFPVRSKFVVLSVTPCPSVLCILGES